MLDFKYTNRGEALVPREAVFNDALLKEMFKVFNDFCKQFKIDEKQKFTDVTKRGMKYNMNVEIFNEHTADFVGEKKRSKINLNKINSTLALLQNHTFDELVKMKVMSKSTMYSTKNKMKKLGITPNQLAVDSLEVHTSLSFDRYIDSYLSDKSPLKLGNKYFI